VVAGGVELFRVKERHDQKPHRKGSQHNPKQKTEGFGGRGEVGSGIYFLHSVVLSPAI
jgi:hypothetical protein